MARKARDAATLRAKVGSVPPDMFEDAPEPVDSVKTEQQARLKEMQAVAATFKNYRPAREVLTRVKAIPTPFVQFDHATRVGGFPIERITTVIGPSNHGKTQFVLGLLYGALQQNHFARLDDLERTTPITWLEKMMGAMADHPYFSAGRNNVYEEYVDNLKAWAEHIGELRTKERIPPGTTGIAALDSLSKLTPRKFFEKAAKAGDAASEKTGVDRMGGMGGMIKAGLNSAWFDDLIVTLEQTMCAAVIITRESIKEADNMFAAPEIIPKGGSSVVYESSLLLRIERQSWITQGADKEKETLGERHRITIRKTKVAGKQEKMPVAFFHTSNGRITPEGFDRARDVLELAEKFEVVKPMKNPDTGKVGNWLGWGRQRWNGRNAAAAKLNESPKLLADLEEVVRAHFASVNPETVDEDGVVT